MDVLRDGSLLMDSENQKDSPSSVLGTDPYEFKHRRSSSKWNDDLSTGGSTITESTQAGELISGSSCGSKLPIVCLCPVFPALKYYRNPFYAINVL